MGGLGGCPFAQEDLVGNIPTEEVLRALEQRGLTAGVAGVQPMITMNAKIAAEFGVR
jgi:hydroxymethylglutaryl-CoA lyase